MGGLDHNRILFQYSFSVGISKLEPVPLFSLSLVVE